MASFFLHERAGILPHLMQFVNAFLPGFIDKMTFMTYSDINIK